MPRQLLDPLPTVVQVDSVSTGVTTSLEPVFALLRHEVEHAAPGAQAIFANADVLLRQPIRVDPVLMPPNTDLNSS
jgi:hypothetical protein